MSNEERGNRFFRIRKNIKKKEEKRLKKKSR